MIFFSFVLENNGTVLRRHRSAREQFSIYWSNGSKRYEPDFIVETADAIYMVETKAAVNISNEEAQQKKQAAEEYYRHASEFTAENGDKPWKYILLARDKVERTSSFEYSITMSLR